nr:putative RNA-directed DNA polymerase, eukaryota [Tanacetum cinerariifolium]
MAYIKGCQIIDGPLIDEIISSAKLTRGKVFFLKVDFEKVFDLLNWPFSELIVSQIGFSIKWRKWIDACLKSAYALVLINGSPTGIQTCKGAFAKSYDLPLLKVNKSGSGEDNMEHQDDLMDVVPPTPHDSPLLGGHTHGSDEEEAKTTQDNVITILKLRVRRLEKKRKARTSQPIKRRLFKGRVETSTDKSFGKDASKQGRNDDKIEELNLTDGADTEVLVEDKGSGEKGGSTARTEVSTATPSTPPTTTTIFGDKDLTIAQTLIKLRSEKAKEKGVAFRDVDEPSRLTRSTITLQPLPTIKPKDKELAQRIYKEELAELNRVQKERQKQEEATIATLTEEFDEIQARMDAGHELALRMTHEEQEKYTIKSGTKMITYLKHMGKYTHQQLKHKTFKELQKLYQKEQKWIDDFVPMDSKKEEKKSVKPKSKGKKGKRIKRVVDLA